MTKKRKRGARSWWAKQKVLARVAPAPEGFRKMCGPDEKWTIWVHKQPNHFEWESFGASAGFMEEGAEVEVLKAWNVRLKEGPLAEETLRMYKVRGPDENGRVITGWALENCFVLVPQ